MEKIKAHLEKAYEQLAGMVVGGEGKVPVGLAMAELIAAMAEILEMEKGKDENETS